jgi:hypothetical protein
MKRGRTEPMKCGDELDAFTGWRRLLCVFYNNTGIAKYCKTAYNKRVRRKAKEELRDE